MNNSVLASVMAVRAGEQAGELEDSLNAIQQARVDERMHENAFGFVSAMHGLKQAQGNESGARLAQSQMKDFMDKKVQAGRVAKRQKKKAVKTQAQINSVVVKLTEQLK